MKIFNRGNETKGATPAVAATAPAPPAPAQVEAPPPPPAPDAPDLAVVLDANVKEMSEKIARLASSLENSEQDRTGFEAKIDQMEERMRKLSSLTEMISAQYNPFVGDAPSERDSLPRPEIGLAAPPSSAAATTLDLPPPPPPAFAAPDLAVDLGTPPPPPAPFGELPDLDLPAAAGESFDDDDAPEAFPTHTTSAQAPHEEPGIYLWSVPHSFESSMLLLGWSDMLLKSAGSRESLVDLVNYYHNIGWLGDPARDQLLAYADGLATPAEGATHDWRADVEVHEKSLLFVEKLRAVIHRRNG